MEVKTQTYDLENESIETGVRIKSCFEESVVDLSWTPNGFSLWAQHGWYEGRLYA